MTTRVWTKKQTQEVIKVLRDAGLPVVKANNKYETIVDGKTLFRAMLGTNSYLVTYVDNLFVQQ